MHNDFILKYYWDIFLSHTCEFFPLEKEFIANYEYELDWRALSKNRAIEWDLTFLEQYEDRFAWFELSRNESILWNEAIIDRFKKRIDWHGLAYNKNLPINEKFIHKYSKKLIIAEDSPLLTKSLIDQYKIKTVPQVTYDSQAIKEYSDSDFNEVFNKFTFYHNQKVIFEKVFMPIIKETSIDSIFETKFDYRQRYYFLEAINTDIHGLTPEFEIEGINPFKDYREGLEPFHISDKINLVNGPLQNGPDRLYEIPRFSSYSFYPMILVSENVRQMLDQFKLPHHLYHEVNLIPKKISTNTKFYLLQLAFDTLKKDLVYENRQFHYSVKEFENRIHGSVDRNIGCYREMKDTEGELGKVHSTVRVNIEPDSYYLTTDFDLYTFSVYKEIIVNQYLKDALEKSFPGQMLFKSAQLLNIRIDQRKYDGKKKVYCNVETVQRLSYDESAEDRFYSEKKARLELADKPISVTQEDEFTKKEQELNVIFPEIFKRKYINNKLRISRYNLLPISMFYLENGYSERFPETYKSVVIAEDGCGDTVNLLLKRSSDVELQNGLYLFLHETGEYKKLWR